MLEHLLARRTLIYGTSITSSIDSAPAWFKRLLHGRLPQSDGSPLRHMLCCCQRKNMLSCAQGKPMFRREQRSGDAQGGTADDGPGVVSQVVSQVVKNAPARERRWRLGAWDSGEGSGRSDGVVVERGSRQIPAQKMDQWQRSLLQAGIRLARQGRLLRLVSSYLPAQPHASMTGCESDWAASLTCTVCQLEVRCRR